MNFNQFETVVQVNTEPDKDGFFEARVYLSIRDMPDVEFNGPEIYRGLSRNPAAAIKFALEEMEKALGPAVVDAYAAKPGMSHLKRG